MNVYDFKFKGFRVLEFIIINGICFFLLNAFSQTTHPYDSNEEVFKPILFANGIINTIGDEYGPTFSPDGTTLYFVKRLDRNNVEYIYTSQFESGKWSNPTISEFSGYDFDKEPFVSTDGNKLFFASKRPVEGSIPSEKFNLWFVTKEQSEWSKPQLVNNIQSDGNDNYPSIAANGNLYFASDRTEGFGENDLYVSRYNNGKYSDPVNLGSTFNTKFSDADPYIAPDESYIIFSSEREDSYGKGDLYISFNNNGKWSTPQNLGPNINTKDHEYSPLVSPNKKYLFFSRGWGEIDYVEFQTVLNDIKLSGKNER